MGRRSKARERGSSMEKDRNKETGTTSKRIVEETDQRDREEEIERERQRNCDRDGGRD